MWKWINTYKILTGTSYFDKNKVPSPEIQMSTLATSLVPADTWIISLPISPHPERSHKDSLLKNEFRVNIQNCCNKTPCTVFGLLNMGCNNISVFWWAVQGQSFPCCAICAEIIEIFILVVWAGIILKSYRKILYNYNGTPF